MALIVLFYGHSSVKPLLDNYRESPLSPAGGFATLISPCFSPFRSVENPRKQRRKGDAPPLGPEQKGNQKQLFARSMDGEKWKRDGESKEEREEKEMGKGGMRWREKDKANERRNAVGNERENASLSKRKALLGRFLKACDICTVRCRSQCEPPTHTITSQ